MQEYRKELLELAEARGKVRGLIEAYKLISLFYQMEPDGCMLNNIFHLTLINQLN